MSLTIILPEPVATQLQQHATIKHCSTDEAATKLIGEALGFETVPNLANGLSAAEINEDLLKLIERIRATPPNPRNQFSEADLRASSDRLGKYLAASIAAEDPNEPFDVNEWERQWDAVEAEMKAITIANRLAEEHL